MSEEIKSIFKSRNYWMAFAISFLTLLGYSLSSWLNAIRARAWNTAKAR